MPKPRYQIDVAVESRYLPEQSRPHEKRYAFAYTVTLLNSGDQAAKLMTRHWIITDGNGHVQEVRGSGVIGQHPYLAPGQSHTYSSGTIIATQVGSMYGSFQMRADDGHFFEAPVAIFSLIVPGALH